MNTEYPPRHLPGYRIPDAEPVNETAKLRERIAEFEQQLATWETELSAVMPPDFKDWYQNAKSEWPTVARMVIESLRRSETKAWEQLATALTPRPIAEAGPVKEGFVRIFCRKSHGTWLQFGHGRCETDTHYLDIRLPSDSLRAEPQDDTAKLRERIAELKREYVAVRESLESQQRVFRQDNEMLEERLHAARKELATALTPRPIAEAGPVKAGFVRLTGRCEHGIVGFSERRFEADTHYLDIRLPSDSFRAEYERAVAEAGGAFEAWLQAKGGVK